MPERSVKLPYGLLPGRASGKRRPHEGSFVTEHTAAVNPDAVCFDEIRVSAGQGTRIARRQPGSGS